MRKKILPILFTILFMTLFLFYHFQKQTMVETFNMGKTSRTDLADQLIIAMFIENIYNDVQSFYTNYISTNLQVFNYDTTILDITENSNNLISITFGVTPEIGAHNPIAYDKLTYTVDPFGTKLLLHYNHKKNYDIPPQYNDLIKSPLPQIEIY